jgi:hypothetical protein
MIGSVPLVLQRRTISIQFSIYDVLVMMQSGMIWGML